jgi:hypothetical protein
MESVVGFGEKAASHFMRNTGLMRGWSALPIIDTHIHKALEVYQLPHKGYPDAECSFTALATKTGIPPLLLDAVLWCAYAKNWDVTHSDFDNFGYTTVINKQEQGHSNERNHGSRSTNSQDTRSQGAGSHT